MSPLTLLLSVAFAEEPPLYAGLPLTELEALDLGAPTLSRVTHEIRLSLPQGGWAALHVAPSLDEAKAAFAGQMMTGATRWPPADMGLPGDEGVGDGSEIVLVRDRNAVLTVRVKDGGAADVAARILGALTTDEAQCSPVLKTEEDAVRGDMTWDRCGRRKSE